jgi:hypothetical protein
VPPKGADTSGELLGEVAGFSLHAGVSTRAHERDKLERLCRYIARPAVSEARLSLTESGNIRYELKTRYRNGTTHMIFEPLDFISKLAALVPVPRVNLTRFHEVFAPHHAYRACVVKEENKQNSMAGEVQTASERRAAMSLAKRLKRVFDLDITVCEACGRAVKIIACIEDPEVINQILSNFRTARPHHQRLRPLNRAPPVRA